MQSQAPDCARSEVAKIISMSRSMLFQITEFEKTLGPTLTSLLKSLEALLLKESSLAKAERTGPEREPGTQGSEGGGPNKTTLPTASIELQVEGNNLASRGHSRPARPPSPEPRGGRKTPEFSKRDKEHKQLEKAYEMLVEQCHFERVAYSSFI
jgi:hypothetical protein